MGGGGESDTADKDCAVRSLLKFALLSWLKNSTRKKTYKLEKNTDTKS